MSPQQMWRLADAARERGAHAEAAHLYQAAADAHLRRARAWAVVAFIGATVAIGIVVGVIA